MVGKAASTALSGMSLLFTGLLLAGCAGTQPQAPAWTAQPGQESPGTGSPTPAGPTAASPSGTAPPSASPTAPQPAATASSWKTFSDPGKTVSFDLPQDWIAQSVPPEDGALAGALKVEVKKPDGTFMAALRTGLPPSSADCPDTARRPYTVISSVPMELPAAGGEGTIPPRMVYRVIQGYRFFGSYGITNVVGGADGQACELRNVVRGPAGQGDYSFGDVVSLKAFAPDEKVAPALAFDTLAQAAQYVNESSDFANVQRMLMSLKVKN
ncbi:superantigen-like protein SSL4 [Arthrobacter sp. C152]